MSYKPPIEFARYLRQASSSYEHYLWQLLRNRQRRGMKFRRQHPIGPYTANFYCVEAKLVVELDGSPHHTSEGIHKDEARDAWMHAHGIKVLRFGGWQVESDVQQVLWTIDIALQGRCPTPKHPLLPSPGTPGEGSKGEGGAQGGRNRMNPKDIENAKNPDLRGSLDALRRAAAMARQTAIQTGTELVISRDGQVVRITADELRKEPQQP
jgi:very-short-patch-repair endonuclease